ncbi:MAG: fibronectin type III domain-containing protein [Bacteroidetes bacterium]|nr:fibronectin type III domain-containing protein [Bacteroidota bacterium]
MKYITNFFGVGCVALLAMLIVAPGAFAQQLTKPNPPNDLEARAGAADKTMGDQQGRITLTWSPVTGDDNGGRDVPLTADGYQIEVSKDGDVPWTEVPDAQITVTPAAVSGDPTKFTAVHILPEETDDASANTASHNLTRHYRVSAINIIGTGAPSDPEMATTHNVPDPPTDLAAVAGDATNDAAEQQGRITLTWSPINKANNGGIAVENTAGTGATGGYMLEFWDTEADPDPEWVEITAGVTNADGTPAIPKFTAVHDLSSLTPSYNITRRYRVRAISAAGQGDNSPEVSGTTHDVPGVPRGVTVSGVTVTSTDAALNDIGISWNAVSGSDLPITGYNVQRLTDAAAATWADITGGTPVAPVAGKVDTADVGLAENVDDPPVYVTYHYRVRAVSAAGDGDWSEVTTGVKLAPPGVPTEFTAVALDKRETIALSWTAPMNDGEPDDYKYKIELSEDYTDDNDDSNDTWGDLPGFPADYAGRAYRHRNLTAGKKYHYRVSAVNVVGESATTNIVSVISSDKALAPRNLSAMLDADGVTINLSWDEPEDNDAGDPGDGGSPIRGYKIEVSEDGGTTWADVEEDKLVHPESELFAQSGDKEYEYSHVGGDPGTSYTYRVSAVNDAGPGVVSASSATVSLDAGAPGAPIDLTLMSAIGMSAITLEWAAPASDGGSPITGYEIEWSSDGTDGSWEGLAIAITDDGAAPPETKFSAVHTGLKAGTEYHYRVKAINVASPNGGDFSAPESATTGAAPDAPTTLTPIPSQGRSAISLLWTAPADIGGSNIVGYKIEVTTEDPSVAASWPEDPLVENTGDTDVIYSHTGLKAVTEYHYRVSAINGHGTGDPSDVASATTLVVAPNPPSDLAAVATPGVAGSITLSWSPVADAENGGSPILEGTAGYSVEFTDDPTDAGSWSEKKDEIVVTAPDPDAQPATTKFSAVHTLTADPSHNLTRHYRVKAINATSTTGGDFSASASATTHNVPDPPSDLAAEPTPGAAGSITLSWSPVADEDNGGLSITEGTAGYSVEVTGDPTDEMSWATSTEIVITAPDPDAQPATTMFSAVHTLTADPSHNLTRHYRVKATNAAGTGGPSGAVSETTHNVPDPPNDLAAEPTEGAAGSITLSWSPVADENNGGLPIMEGTAGYSVEVTGDPTDETSWATSTEIVVTAPDPDAEPATTMFSAVHTLTADPSHNLMRHYRVKAINATSADGGDFSASVSATTHNVPAPPSDLAAVATEGTAGSITLSWSPVADENNGGLSVTSHSVEVSDDAGTTWGALTADIMEPDADATPATTKFSVVHDLSAEDPSHNLTRHYRVKAINAASADGGDFSASVSATTHNVPAPPTDLRTMARGEGTVVLTWTAPDVDRGPAITGYRIEVSEDYSDSAPDAANWTDLMANTGSTDVTYSHSGLTDKDSRYYRVSAISSAGTGTPSDVAGVTTARVTRYAISSGGSSSSANGCPFSTPCTLEAAIEAGVANDVVLVQIRRGTNREIATISEAITIDKSVSLGVYVRGNNASAKGGVHFSGPVKLMSDANLMTYGDASLRFTEIEINGTPSIDELVISADDLTIDEVDDPDNTMTSVLAVGELFVDDGETLTIGEDASVRVRLKKGAPGKMIGQFDVAGTVDGGGDLWIAHTSDERAASGFMLHEPGDYLPDEEKITVDDCLMVTGNGTVESDLYAVAAGNVCVSLKKIGNLVVIGSIDGTNDITTDVIFETDVTVEGNIQQWNDARVLFEQDATIEGHVILDDYGVSKDVGVRTDFGVPNSTPDDYVERVDDEDDVAFAPAGVEFAGASNTIKGDLDLRFGDDDAQVIFSVDSGESESRVKEDLLIADGGRILLQGAPGVPTDSKDNPRAHNLFVEGDVEVSADAIIEMWHPAKSTISDKNDVCSPPGLKFGNKVTLSGDVAFTEEAELEIRTVVIADDVTVKEEGTLIATTVHVTEDGELDSEGSVQIEDALILQGDGLEGSLANGSTVDYLTYATIDSDEVALDKVRRLSVDVGVDNTLRLLSAATLNDLGLCSGAVVLVDPDPGTDGETMTVAGLLVVRDGTLALDTSRPGSIGTDVTKPIAGSDDGYILKYVTGGEYMTGREWFTPRKVVVEHKDAVIIVNEPKSLAEGVHIFKGHLHMKGDGSHLTVGMPSVTGISPFVMVDEGELHSNGNNVLVHGTVTVATVAKQVGKIVTGGGELHVLGRRNSGGHYVNESAVATVGKGGTIDVGTGALQLGPAYTAPARGLEGRHGLRPDVRLTVMGAVTGKIFVPAGSKETWINGEAFDTVVLDATANPGTNNWGGSLYFHDTKVVIDSLAAMNGGAVEFYDETDPKTDKYAIEIKKDVELNSARIYVNGQNSLKFGGNLAIGGTGGMTAWDQASVTVMGDFTQNAGKTTHAEDGVLLNARVDDVSGDIIGEFTVMGDFMVADSVRRFGTSENYPIVLKGDFHFGAVKLGGADPPFTLKAALEFSGGAQQSIETAAIIDLHNVTINNTGKGVMLMSDVRQSDVKQGEKEKAAELTLERGVISTGEHAWIFKNTMSEANLVRRTSAQGGERCGPNGDEMCEAAIWKGSRQSNVSGTLTRHLLDGNSSGGVVTGGYLFPMGGHEGDKPPFRPVILQVPDNLQKTVAVAVTLMGPADDANLLENDNLLVQADGGALTLNAHSDMFWKLDLEENLIYSGLNIRVAADGLENVFDSRRIRIVQWDCDWSNPRLAGTYDVGGASHETTFAVNDFINGVLNVTQEGVDVEEGCSILGIASNGLENPIHLDPVVGSTQVQFIHNLPLPVPVDLYYGDVKLAGNLGFRDATGYGYYDTTGDDMLRIVPVGVPAGTIEISLNSLANGQSHAVIAHGAATEPRIKMVNTKLKSSVENMVEAILVHGSGDLGDVDVRVLDPADNMTPTKLLANNFSFDSTTGYLSLAPGAHSVQVTSPDNREEVEVYYLDLNGYQGETVILNLSGSKDDLELMGVANDGEVFLSQVITGVEEEGTAEIPTEFTLHGNYPNPFNPSTRIEFDLPEAAQVTLQVVDMLGREVMTLPAREFEAGANRTLELNAINMASGTYLYRMIATGAESRYVKTGRMTLMK